MGGMTWSDNVMKLRAIGFQIKNARAIAEANIKPTISPDPQARNKNKM
jgi:hypothetical protein